MNKLDEVYIKNTVFDCEINEKELVILKKANKHKIQKFFRKIGLKVPEYTTIELDEISSFVFLQINGKNTVNDICELMKIKFGTKIEPCEERLDMFLSYLIDHNQISCINEEK